MEIQEIGEDEEDEDYGYVLATNRISTSSKDKAFKKNLYRSKLRNISVYLNAMKKQEDWSNKAFKKIKHQSYDYVLRNFSLWKSPKKKNGVPLKVVDDPKIKNQLFMEFHDIL